MGSHGHPHPGSTGDRWEMRTLTQPPRPGSAITSRAPFHKPRLGAPSYSLLSRAAGQASPFSAAKDEAR